MAKIAMFQVEAGCAENEIFVIHCCFRPLFGLNGRKNTPFTSLSYFKVIPWRYSEKDGRCTVDVDGERQF